MCTRVTDEAFATPAASRKLQVCVYALTQHMAWGAIISVREKGGREGEELISMGRLSPGRLQIWLIAPLLITIIASTSRIASIRPSIRFCKSFYLPKDWSCLSTGR